MGYLRDVSWEHLLTSNIRGAFQMIHVLKEYFEPKLIKELQDLSVVHVDSLANFKLTDRESLLYFQTDINYEEQKRAVIQKLKTHSDVQAEMQGLIHAELERGILEPFKVEKLHIRSMEAGKSLLSFIILCLTNMIYPPSVLGYVFPIPVNLPGRDDERGGTFGSAIDMGVCLSCYTCMNWDCNSSKPPCQNLAMGICNSCELVAYCNPHCGMEHDCQAGHGLICNRIFELRMAGYKPSPREKCEYPQNEAAIRWDTTPLIALVKHNGPDEFLPTPLRMSFDGCYDLSNIIQTLGQINADRQFKDMKKLKSKREITFYINCSDHHAVARNLIISCLLAAWANGDFGDSIGDAIIAIWYSAFLTLPQYLLLIETITSILKDAKIMDTRLPVSLTALSRRLNMNSDKAYVDRLVNLKNSECHVHLHSKGPEIWKYLVEMTLLNWSLEGCEAARMQSVNATDNSQAIEQYLIPEHVEAVRHFRLTGMLLPYGQYSGHHVLPNPTLFSATMGWIGESSSVDCFGGWPINKVLEKKVAPFEPQYDLYGNFFFHLKDALNKALATIRDTRVNFQFFAMSSELFTHHLTYKDPGLMALYRGFTTLREYSSLPQVLRHWAPLFGWPRNRANCLVLKVRSHKITKLSSQLNINPRLEVLDKFMGKVNSSEDSKTERFKDILLQYVKDLREDKVSSKVDRLRALLLTDNQDELPRECHGMKRRTKNIVVPHTKMPSYFKLSNYDPNVLVNKCYYDIFLSRADYLTNFIEWTVNR